MKKIIFLTTVLLIAMSFSFTANAWWWDDHGHKGEGRTSGEKHQHEWGHKVCERPPVSAPLDGGILSILGAAGLAYYVARKKKAA